MIDQIIVLIFMLCLSAFFSSAETALFSISKVKAAHIAKDENKTNVLIKNMKEDPHKLLTTILIGNNLVNVGASALATVITMQYISNNAISIATGIMTFLILVFGEIIPKTIATRNNTIVAKLVIHPLYWLSILFSPAIIFLNFIPKISGKIKKPPRVTEDELITMVEVVEEEGAIKGEEKELIQNIIRFDDTSASAIMTSSADMFVINAREKLKLEDIIKSGYSRIPVIEGDMNKVIGIINIKDLFKHLTLSGDEIDVRKVMHKPYFIPENKKIDTLLHQFKRRKHHIAVVVDEHGEVTGVVTLEDVLEELVGEIIDETDKIEHHITQTQNKEWIVLGKSEIDKVNDAIPMEIPESNEYETFSGFILKNIGKIPGTKEKFTIGEFDITVKEKERNRIKTFVVRQRQSSK